MSDNSNKGQMLLDLAELKRRLERRDARILELEAQLEAARQPQERGSTLPDDGVERDRLVMAMALAYENSPAHDLIGPMEDAYSALLREIGQPQERGEAVAWQYRRKDWIGPKWDDCGSEERASLMMRLPESYEVRALYAHPPADDARVAELEKQLVVERSAYEVRELLVKAGHERIAALEAQLAERESERESFKGMYYIAAKDRDDLRQKLTASMERWGRLREVLDDLVRLIKSAGVSHLMTGVQLGRVSWAVKMNDALDTAIAALTAEKGEKE